MTNYTEIIQLKESYLFNQEKRTAFVSVYKTNENNFLCTMTEYDTEDNHRICMQCIENFNTYKEVCIWLKNVQWYSNGNEYDNSKYED